MRQIFLCSIFLLSGCVGLRQATSDHAIQTRTIVESCRVHEFGSDKCTLEDLEEMAVQAECLAHIQRGEYCP